MHLISKSVLHEEFMNPSSRPKTAAAIANSFRRVALRGSSEFEEPSKNLSRSVSKIDSNFFCEIPRRRGRNFSRDYVYLSARNNRKFPPSFLREAGLDLHNGAPHHGVCVVSNERRPCESGMRNAAS